MTDRGDQVVSVTGLVDERWESRISEALDRAGGSPIVIDLSDAILVSRSPLARALRSAASPEHLAEVSIVCPRISAVMLLRRWKVTELVRVYASREELDAAAPQPRGGASAPLSHPLPTIAG